MVSGTSRRRYVGMLKIVSGASTNAGNDSRDGPTWSRYCSRAYFVGSYKRGGQRRRGQTTQGHNEYFIHRSGMDGEVLDDRPQGQSWQKEGHQVTTLFQ